MKRVIVITLSCLLLSSCSKEVLNKQPLDIVSDAVLWNDATLINAYLLQCFARTYIFTNEAHNGGIGWDNWNASARFTAWGYVNEISDESIGAYDGLGAHFARGNLTASGGILEWWEIPYEIIRNLNEFIVRVPSSPLNESEKTRYVAEARFLRAFNYFSMVKRYGGVPLITKALALNDSEEELFPKRAKEQEIYDYILHEIDDFQDDLLERNTASDFGRPTKYAALALKSRAALYAGSIAKYGQVQLDGILGISNDAANGYYLQAFNAAKEIEASGYFALYEKFPTDRVRNFRQLFLEKDHQEAIFVKKHNDVNAISGSGNGWGYDFFQGPRPNGWGAGNKNAPYLEMMEAFEYIDGTPGTIDRGILQSKYWKYEELVQNKDPRFLATIYMHGTPWKGGRLDFHRGIDRADGGFQVDGSYNGVLAVGVNYEPNGTGLGVMKYLDESFNSMEGGDDGGFSRSDQDWMVFRYAEVLLNLAEAALEMNSANSGEALRAINLIRARAGISLLSGVDVARVRHERKVELAFEGHRYWDVRRWRIAEEVLSKPGSGLQYIFNSTGDQFRIWVNPNADPAVTPPRFFARNYYLPITPNRTGANPNLVENIGY